MINVPKLILASGSPRRSEILGFVGWEFEKHVADIDETELKGEAPSDYVQRLAGEKARAVAINYKDALVLGYPYPLVKADALARVSNEESNFARTRFLIKAKEKGVILEKEDMIKNTHDILDSIRY